MPITQNTAHHNRYKQSSSCHPQTTPYQHYLQHNAETKILTNQHLEMRGTQFLATVINNKDRRNYYLQDHPPTHRQINTTHHRHSSNILNIIPQPTNTGEKKKHTHTLTSPDMNSTTFHNKILKGPAPNISSTETQLSKLESVHLNTALLWSPLITKHLKTLHRQHPHRPLPILPC